MPFPFTHRHALTIPVRDPDGLGRVTRSITAGLEKQAARDLNTTVTNTAIHIHFRSGRGPDLRLLTSGSLTLTYDPATSSVRLHYRLDLTRALVPLILLVAITAWWKSAHPLLAGTWALLGITYLHSIARFSFPRFLRTSVWADIPPHAPRAPAKDLSATSRFVSTNHGDCLVPTQQAPQYPTEASHLPLPRKNAMSTPAAPGTPVPENLHPLSFPPFDWKDPGKSLDDLAANVAKKGQQAIDWYWAAKKNKKRAAVILRWTMVILGAIATALPTIAVMSTTADAGPYRYLSVATTLLGITVGLLLALDRLTGASTGWVRYIQTEMQLRMALEDLHLSYIKEKALWGSAAPTPEQTLKALDLIAQHIAKINGVINGETNQWAAEFQTAMKATEDYAKSAPKPAEPGSLTVTLESDIPIDGVWTISINDKDEKSSGKTYAKEALPAGKYRVRITAKGKKPDPVNTGATLDVALHGQAVATIEAGADKTLTIKLHEG